LNPYSSFIIKNLEKLVTYPYSSLPEYLKIRKETYCNKELVLSHFKNTTSYREFVFNQADYQRELEKIKHLIEE